MLKQLQNALLTQDTIIESKTQFAQLDILLVAKTMENAKYGEVLDTALPIIANITDMIMNLSASNNVTNLSRRISSIETTNASNVILDSLDSILNDVKLSKPEGK